MHSNCLASPGKIILWQYPISSVLWLACQCPVTTMPFRATGECSFQSLFHISSILSYFITTLFHTHAVLFFLFFIYLFQISTLHFFILHFPTPPIFTAFSRLVSSLCLTGLFCSLFLLLIIISNLFLLGLVLSLLLFSSSSCILLIDPLVGSLFLVIFSLGLLTDLPAALSPCLCPHSCLQPHLYLDYASPLLGSTNSMLVFPHSLRSSFHLILLIVLIRTTLWLYSIFLIILPHPPYFIPLHLSPYICPWYIATSWCIYFLLHPLINI